MTYRPNFLELYEQNKIFLSEDEKQELDRWLNKNEPVLANSTQGKFFSFFLNGKSCKEIWEMNTAFSYGSILHARILGEWDKRVIEHQKQLLDKTQKRSVQIHLEMSKAILDLIGAQNKVIANRVQKFYETNDEEELPFSIRSTKGLKELIELFYLLSGKSQETEKISGTIKHVLEHNNTKDPLEVEAVASTNGHMANHTNGLIKLLMEKEKNVKT
jgi:hypothetical protein